LTGSIPSAAVDFGIHCALRIRVQRLAVTNASLNSTVRWKQIRNSRHIFTGDVCFAAGDFSRRPWRIKTPRNECTAASACRLRQLSEISAQSLDLMTTGVHAFLDIVVVWTSNGPPPSR